MQHQKDHKTFVKRNLLFVLFLSLFIHSKGESQSLSKVIGEVAEKWTLDSNSCKGYRQAVVRRILEAKSDSISKDFLFSKLGKPNRIKKFYNGNTRRNYVGYIYDVYKDNCPLIKLEGYAIQFVFDQSEKHFIEITEIEVQ